MSCALVVFLLFLSTNSQLCSFFSVAYHPNLFRSPLAAIVYSYSRHTYIRSTCHAAHAKGTKKNTFGWLQAYAPKSNHTKPRGGHTNSCIRPVIDASGGHTKSYRGVSQPRGSGSRATAQPSHSHPHLNTQLQQ
jgi:hypothetical protein